MIDHRIKIARFFRFETDFDDRPLIFQHENDATMQRISGEELVRRSNELENEMTKPNKCKIVDENGKVLFLLRVVSSTQFERVSLG